MENETHHRRARTNGVNVVVYWLIRTPLQLFFHVYLRMSRIGREHIPAHGPAIVASNHRSFFDPFIIGTMTRRPMYYVAKRELFEIHPLPGLAAQRARRLPGRPRQRRPGHDRDRQGAARPRRARADLPRGHTHAPGAARSSPARRRPPRARDRRAGDPGRDHRHRCDPPRLAAAAAQGPGPGRTAAAVPARRRLHAGGRRRRSPTASGRA